MKVVIELEQDTINLLNKYHESMIADAKTLNTRAVRNLRRKLSSALRMKVYEEWRVTEVMNHRTTLESLKNAN